MMFGKFKFVCKDLNNLTAKEKAQLLRIYAGKDSEKILTKEQIDKAKEISKESNERYNGRDGCEYQPLQKYPNERLLSPPRKP